MREQRRLLGRTWRREQQIEGVNAASRVLCRGSERVPKGARSQSRVETKFIARRGPVYTKQKPAPHFYREPWDSSHPLPAAGGRSPSSRFAKHDQLQTTTYNPSTVPANTRAFHSAWIATGTSKLPDARYR